jgi:putative membrane protein
VNQVNESAPAEVVKDPRFYLAAERTFLAWIRTGLSLMGFGFVVARFGLFLREFQMTQHIPLPQHTGFTLWFGTALVVVGVVMNSVAVVQHVRTVHKISRGEMLNRPSYFAMAVAIILAIVGLAMAVYLVSV